MADISSYRESIVGALTGAEIRVPLVNALNAINQHGRDAKTFDYSSVG